MHEDPAAVVCRNNQINALHDQVRPDRQLGARSDAACLETGLAVGALCSIDTINNDVLTNPRLSQWRSFLQVGRCHINPSHALWDLLIARYGCPALKIELLRDNPLGLDTRGWVSLAASPSLNPIVQRHLDRMKKQPCAPTAEQALAEASIPATRFSRHQDA